MQTIYLHIGRGKTGTTTIQSCLPTWQTELLNQGIHYLNADGGKLGSGHQNFGKSFIKELPDYMLPPQSPEQVQATVAAEIEQSKAPIIIISSENLEMADVGSIFRFFEDLPRTYLVKIIFFVRSQDELAESEYNQMVKLKREHKPFEQFIEQDLEGYDFMTAASRWETFFGTENIICRIYDGSTQSIITQFLSCIDTGKTESSVNIGQLIQPVSKSSANTSIGIKALTLAKLLNELDIDDRETHYARLFNQLSANDLPALLMDAEQARQFRQKFASSNHEFTQRFMSSACQDLGGRRYSDQQRNLRRQQIKALQLL